MTHSNTAKAFLERWAEIVDLTAASGLANWDQETHMPPKGQVGRGRMLATLAGIRHERLTDPRLREALEAWAEEVDPDGADGAQVRVARRWIERAARIPTELERRRAEASSRGLAAWQKARAASDFSLFAQELEELVSITREAATCLAPLTASGSAFDALLDEYEPGTSEAELTPLFEDLRTSLVPIVQAVVDSGKTVDDSPWRGHFPSDRQLAFGRDLASQMGFDFEAGRIDAAPHPFCSGFHPSDVRLTWRWQEDDLRPALFGILHEAGHGLYEQGLPEAWSGTPLGPAVSLGVHESQSRLWENLVGRSRAFWTWALPRFREAFPDKADVELDPLVAGLNAVTPSLIRVEADQITYNLHVILRYGLERALFAGELQVGDLPEAWDQACEDLLGLRPPDAASGVLQDIHWSMGAFGYFPTYALGNLIKAQLFEAAREDLGDLEGQLGAGELAPLLGWLRERIHVHGSRYPAAELITRATGRPLTSEPFLRHVRATVESTYGLAV